MRPFDRLRYFSFPILQAAALTSSVIMARESHWLLAVCAFGLSVFCLTFSVHVSFHEAIHHFHPRSQFVRTLFGATGTIVLGFPLDGYRLHHLNHHRHDNGSDDYSCTWEIRDGIRVPISVWRYSLVWWRQALRARADILQKIRSGSLPAHFGRSIRRQKLFLLAFYFVLATYSPFLALLYFGHVYAGWCLVSLYSYGQHLPIANAQVASFSFRNKFYNFLTVNNGLHAEHHDDPGTRTFKLRDGPEKYKLRHGFFRSALRLEASKPVLEQEYGAPN